MRVLLTDGNERATLAAARSLVAAGYDVHVISHKRFSLAGASRGVRSHLITPDPLQDPVGYAVAVGTVAARCQAAVLLPVTDPAVEALLEYRGSLPEEVRIALPDLACYRAAADKVALISLAAAAGLAVPQSVVVRSPADVGMPIPDSWFPCVVKSHRSVVREERRRRSLPVTFVADPRGCERTLRALPAGAFPVLVQRRVRGPGEGLFLLRWQGRTVALFAHRRLREKPPAGGVSVYRESIPIPPELGEAGERLLASLNWNGVAMIECKRDERTGRHVLIEINGRLWGSLQLAIDAGVDFPALLVRCVLGGEVPVQGPYRVGVRSRWFWGDLDHLYLRLTRSAAALQLEAPSTSRLGALVEFLRFRPGRDRAEVWRWRDPAPFLLETLQRLGVA